MRACETKSKRYSCAVPVIPALTCVGDPVPNSAASSQTTSSPARTASIRNFLMCAPEHFEVNSSTSMNRVLAARQWQNLRDTYRLLGHTVSLLDPIPGQADMVFTANGGFSLDGRAYLACFTAPGRRPEVHAFQNWFESHGFDTHLPGWANEGEGDFAVVGGIILAGVGFGSSPKSHAELADIFGREVLSLTLVDSHFHHLNLALAVLDPEAESGPGRIAYLPAAFDHASQAVLARRFPKAIVVDEEEAALLALNSVSDGRHVIVAESAPRYIRQLLDNGYTPVPVDLSELLKGGGGIKSCTQELRR
jgi:N-dimethylarginine dimethylaminohydrolase